MKILSTMFDAIKREKDNFIQGVKTTLAVGAFLLIGLAFFSFWAVVLSFVF